MTQNFTANTPKLQSELLSSACSVCRKGLDQCSVFFFSRLGVRYIWRRTGFVWEYIFCNIWPRNNLCGAEIITLVHIANDRSNTAKCQLLPINGVGCAVHTVICEMAKARLRDTASWLPLAAEASSRNLAFAF